MQLDFFSNIRYLLHFLIKSIYSEKATKFCEIFALLLTTVHTVKSKGKISQNFVAFSEYMNFNYPILIFHVLVKDSFHGITSQYSWFKEILIFSLIQQGTEKNCSCFALNTEQQCWTVQYWTVTVQYLCWVKKNQWLAMFCLYTLPLARPAQAKVQMLTTSSCIVKSIPWNLVNLSHH